MQFTLDYSYTYTQQKNM